MSQLNMKSQRISSPENRTKILKSRYSSPKTNTTFNGKPTPLDFDSFIPWFCLELQVSKNVVVTRTNQVQYVRYESKLPKDSSSKSCKSKSRNTKMKIATSTMQSGIEDKKQSVAPQISFATSTVDITDAIPVTTCYDKRGRLVEIAIIGCPFEIPRKVIQAFNLCLPFHPGLSKLSIRKGGLCQIIIHEISKLLPHSNITEICLDDSRVSGCNYSILLDRPSQIKYLSLKRCNIDDEGCKKIAEKLNLKGSALKTLLLLDLTSNNIMDDGARAFGEILKHNRYLKYLNLSGNRISDAGASFIFKYLQEFPLSSDDINQARRRRMDFLISRSITYEKCLEEVKVARLKTETKLDINVSSNQLDVTISTPQQIHRRKLKKHVGPSCIITETTIEDDAERKTNEIIGEFNDPFQEQCIKRNGDLLYAIGNFTLASLNLAYNNLTALSIRRILRILKYQSEINKLSCGTGLLRVVIDGNNIPTRCDELYEIAIRLKNAVWENEQSFRPTRTQSHFQV